MRIQVTGMLRHWGSLGANGGGCLGLLAYMPWPLEDGAEVDYSSKAVGLQLHLVHELR
jgi:hypothetical protein